MSSIIVSRSTSSASSPLLRSSPLFAEPNPCSPTKNIRFALHAIKQQSTDCHWLTCSTLRIISPIAASCVFIGMTMYRFTCDKNTEAGYHGYLAVCECVSSSLCIAIRHVMSHLHWRHRQCFHCWLETTHELIYQLHLKKPEHDQNSSYDL